MIEPLDVTSGKTVPYLQLTGVARARFGGSWHVFGSDKRYLLLCYLAWAGDWVSRERLADLFWPDASTDHSLSNLRQLLMRVGALELNFSLERNKYSLRFAGTTDLQEIEAAARRGDPKTALALVRGSFLQGATGAESTTLAAWIEEERTRLVEKTRALRLDLVTSLIQAGLLERASALLEDALLSDPLDEEAAYACMKVAIASGRPLLALRVFNRLRQSLHDELRSEPSTFTTHLAQEISRTGLNSTAMVG